MSLCRAAANIVYFKFRIEQSVPFCLMYDRKVWMSGTLVEPPEFALDGPKSVYQVPERRTKVVQMAAARGCFLLQGPD